jgi:hypothetical protein
MAGSQGYTELEAVSEPLLVQSRQYLKTLLFQGAFDIVRFARRKSEIVDALAGLIGCHTDVPDIRAYVIYDLQRFFESSRLITHSHINTGSR